MTRYECGHCRRPLASGEIHPDIDTRDGGCIALILVKERADGLLLYRRQKLPSTGSRTFRPPGVLP